MRSTNLKNKIFHLLTERIIKKNKKYRLAHKGEECFLVGNGASLKYYDLANFAQKISIGCNSLFVHKDFGQLNCAYYQLPAAFIFHRYRRYYNSLMRNYLADIYKEQVKLNKNTLFFTNVANYFSSKYSNVSYEYHYGHRGYDVEFIDMADCFSFMQGGLYAMIGTAIYMGFDKAILVGCDYAHSPQYGRHFFEFGEGVRLDSDVNNDNFHLFMDACKELIDISVITPNGIGCDRLHYQEYTSYTGKCQHYLENTEIVSPKHLQLLHAQGFYAINHTGRVNCGR